MPLTMLIPNLIEKIKPTSTKWFVKTFPEINGFKWQEGYGALALITFSVTTFLPLPLCSLCLCVSKNDRKHRGTENTERNGEILTEGFPCEGEHSPPKPSLISYPLLELFWSKVKVSSL